MRKSTGVLTAIAVVAVAYVGTTWYFGKQAQQSIEQAVARANESMASALVSQPAAGNAKLTVTEYRRRIFSSDIVYSLQIKDSSGRTQELLLGDHLQHGPFPLDAITSGNLLPMLAFSHSQLLPSAATQVWFDSLKGQSPITARSQVGFSGRAKSDWTFKPLNVVQNDEVLKFSGGTLTAAFDNDFNDSRVSGSFGSLDYSLQAGAERIAIEDIRFDYETAVVDAATRLSSTANVAKVSLDLPDDSGFSLHDVVMDVSNEHAGGLANTSIRYDFGKILADGANLGSLSLGVSAKDINMPALSALASTYDAMQARHGPDAEEWQLTQTEAALLQDKFLALLTSNPVLSLEPFVWKNDAGESRGNLTVELMSPAEPEAAQSFDLLLLQIVRALNLELTVEKPMFVQAMSGLQKQVDSAQMADIAGALYDQYANRLQATGLVALQGVTATTQISYREGQVNANGKSMAVPEFIQRALMALLM